MADKNLGFNITAKDDASAVFRKMAQSARRELVDVQEGLDDGRTAGQRMADALSASADEIDRELKATARAADALASALGPEFASTVQRGDLEMTVVQLRNAGLTIEDIEQDAEALAAAIKKVDDAGRGAGGTATKAFDDVDGAVRRTADDVDRTRSVVANFAGNAVQDIPGVSGSFGALNVAAGQFAEYASEGDINLKRMAMAAGPLLVVGGVIAKIGADMAKAAEIRAFNKEQVQEWAEAMRGGASATDAIRQSIEEAGRLELKGEGIFGVTTDDLEESLSRTNVTMDQFLQMTRMSESELQTYMQSIGLATAADEDKANIMMGLAQITENAGAATEEAARQTQVYGQSQKDAEEDTAELTLRLEEQKRGYEELLAAQLAQFDSNLAYRQSVDGLEESMAGLAETQKEHGEDSEEYRDALMDAEGAVLSQADAAVRLAEDQAKAAGNTLDAAAKTQIYRDNLAFLAGTMAPGSPLRVQLEGYVAQLDAVPSEVRTKMLVEAGGAFDTVREFLGYLDAIGSHNVVGNTALLTFKQQRMRAAGGDIPPGGVIAGEGGLPELIEADAGGGLKVLDGQRTRSRLSQAGGSGALVHVEHLHTGTLGDLERAVDFMFSARGL